MLRIRCAGLGVALAGLVLATAAGALVYASYTAGVDRAAAMLLDESADSVAAWWQRELRAGRAAIEGLRRDTQRDIDALALRLGTLQAHIARVDALGERLAARAGLAAEEFGFGAPPALGGAGIASDTADVALEELVGGLATLSAELQEREEKLVALEGLLMNRKLQAAVQPEGRPVASGWISSGFGVRTDPVNGKREFHRGIDFASRTGTEVLAVAAGVVTGAGRRAAYGNTVEISHGNGLVTRYSHNKENLVQVGDKVTKGQVIARMGSTGRTTGPHVHFEVARDGRVVNPLPYIRAAAD